MDHRVSKDMISQGMSVTGEKKTEELGGSQYGSAATPSSLMSAYSSMYSEDAKWGYDPKTGKSLNPRDRKKVKEDIEQINEIPVVAAALPLAGKALAAGGAKVAAAGGAKAVAGKVAGSALKQAAAEKAVSTVMGGNKKKEQVAASHELDGDVLKELQDSGLFSEEELKSITEISSSKLLDAAKASEVSRGKKAVAGDKAGAAKEVVRSKKFYDASVSKRKEGK